MNLMRAIVVRSLRFYARSHIGTFLGVAVASAVLVGALTVGDCVRQSLLDMQAARLGRTDFALVTRDRLFRASLGGELSAPDRQVSAVLQFSGVAVNADGSARANRVQVLGVDDGFWKLAPEAGSVSLPAQSVALNATLAEHLGVKVGDTVLIRLPKPTLLPGEMPMAPRQETSTAFRWTVSAVVPDGRLGRFSLQASQVPPFNVFVGRDFLESKLGLTNKANLLLVAQPTPTVTNLAALLKTHFRLADAEVQTRAATNGIELTSGRVFIDPPLARAALKAAPGARPISTYFINELKVADKTTPYSMVTAIGEPLVPADMADDEIVINQWLADDLHAKPGDKVALTYLVLSDTGRLEEKHDHFRVHAIVPLEGLAADRTLMPDFPGIAKAEKTENWDAGFPLDMKKIRPKDEQYWKDHRGTPKAFVTVKAGERMWGNRFGDLTAIRMGGITGDALESAVLRELDPETLGFSFLPVRAQATAASTQSEDFGGLFIGFSFFLIIAALILMALLFQFGLEKRAVEIGTLLAVGIPARKVRRMLLMEGLAIAVLGSVVGTACGVLYARGILYALTTLWRSAVGTSALQFHWTAGTLAGGGAAAIVISMFVIWLGLRRQAGRPARELLNFGSDLEPARRGRRWAGWLSIASAAGAVILVADALRGDNHAGVEAFFGGGTLLLIAGISGVAVWLRSLAAGKSELTMITLGIRSCGRRRARSLATIALLASGAFLIIAVEANKLDSSVDSASRSSGTGGFALIGESTLPVLQDLNTKAGREFFGLTDLPGIEFVPLRVRDGDDASCLNLNRAQVPRLLGVNPDQLQSREAFAFTGTTIKTNRPWLLLRTVPAADAIPAIADEASILWALGKKLGDTLDYADERGNRFKIRLVGALANSILQGNLVIDEAEFVRRFPGESGHRFFLIDVTGAEAGAGRARNPQPGTATLQVAATLGRALEDQGLELTPATRRLDAFNAVQNTYLNTFQLLGGLGLLLGSAGLGTVVLRNILERRAELGLLLAVGFKPKRLRQLVLIEHGALLALGLALGIGAALIAVAPALSSPASRVSWVSLGGTLALVLANGIFWPWLAARIALQGKLIDSLRGE